MASLTIPADELDKTIRTLGASKRPLHPAERELFNVAREVKRLRAEVAGQKRARLSAVALEMPAEEVHRLKLEAHRITDQSAALSAIQQLDEIEGARGSMTKGPSGKLLELAKASAERVRVGIELAVLRERVARTEHLHGMLSKSAQNMPKRRL